MWEAFCLLRLTSVKVVGVKQACRTQEEFRLNTIPLSAALDHPLKTSPFAYYSVCSTSVRIFVQFVSREPWTVPGAEQGLSHFAERINAQLPPKLLPLFAFKMELARSRPVPSCYYFLHGMCLLCYNIISMEQPGVEFCDIQSSWEVSFPACLIRSNLDTSSWLMLVLWLKNVHALRCLVSVLPMTCSPMREPLSQ